MHDNANPLVTLRRERNQRKREILASLKDLRVLEHLSTRQQVRLAGHVLTISEQYDLHGRVGGYERSVDVWCKRGPGQLRRLRSRIERAQQVLTEVRFQAESISASENIYLTQTLTEDFHIGDRIAQIASALDTIQLPSDEIFEYIPGHRSTASDPTTTGTELLYEFLTGECAIVPSDSTQRIARIGNALWGWNIADSDPESRTPNRSDAIRKRLGRSVRGHSNKSPR
jgi:hypothetical protein